MKQYKIFKEKLHEFKLLPRNYEYTFIQFHACPNCNIIHYITEDGGEAEHQLLEEDVNDEQVQEILDIFYAKGFRLHHTNIAIELTEDGVAMAADWYSPLCSNTGVMK